MWNAKITNKLMHSTLIKCRTSTNEIMTYVLYHNLIGINVTFGESVVHKFICYFFFIPNGALITFLYNMKLIVKGWLTIHVSSSSMSLPT